MEFDSALLILNANAGQGRQTEALRRLAAQCRGMDIREPTRQRSAQAIAAEAVAAGYDLVIAAGGDGTIHHIINGLSADFERCRFAILPIGSANDLAKTLDIPLELEEAFDLLHHGEEKRIDVVHAQGDAEPPFYMINAATGGFSQVVNEKLNDETKSLWGSLAYFRAAVEALPEMRPYQLTVEADDQVQVLHTGALVISNGRYAGGVKVMPTAEISDGKLDLLAVMAETLGDRSHLMAQFAMGQHHESEHCVYYRARRVRIEASPAMQFSSDGEDFGHTPITFEVVPRAVRILVPEDLS